MGSILTSVGSASALRTAVARSIVRVHVPQEDAVGPRVDQIVRAPQCTYSRRRFLGWFGSAAFALRAAEAQAQQGTTEHAPYRYVFPSHLPMDAANSVALLRQSQLLSDIDIVQVSAHASGGFTVELAHREDVARLRENLIRGEPGYRFTTPDGTQHVVLSEEEIAHCETAVQHTVDAMMRQRARELTLPMHAVLPHQWPILVDMGLHRRINTELTQLLQRGLQRESPHVIAAMIGRDLRSGESVWSWGEEPGTRYAMDPVARHAVMQQLIRDLTPADSSPTHHARRTPEIAQRRVRDAPEPLQSPWEEATRPRAFWWGLGGVLFFIGCGVITLLRRRGHTAQNSEEKTQILVTSPTPVSVSLQPPFESDLGRILDTKYRIDTSVGEGGMGSIYRGVQLSTGRSVAIKLLAAGTNADGETAQRFRREARLAASLRHPHTVQIIDFGQVPDDGPCYLVMELLEGESLAQRLRRGRLPIPEAIQITRQLLQSLAEAHANGIVHRDVKPANIMLTRIYGVSGDFVKVIDFGIAKSYTNDRDALTHTNMVVGTPSYMSPEQVMSKPVDQRSDLYAVGLLLYEMLAGEKPFHANTPMAAAVAHARERPRPLVFPGSQAEYASLRALVERLLATTPAKRPKTAEAVLAALARIDTHHLTSTRFQMTCS